MLRRRLFFSVLFAGFLAGVPFSVHAQSVESVVEQMRAQYQQQLESVDTYVVETNLYTSYNRKVTRDGEATYESATQLKGNEGSPFATSTTPSAAYGLQLDRLKQHAAYAGTETVDGRRVHVLQVDAPEKVNPDMRAEDAESMTYYIDAEQSVPVRIVMTTRQGSGRGPQPSNVTINMRDYRTTQGLTLPYRMEFQVNMQMSDRQRKQMEQAMKQMENMPEQQRKQMEKMMGGQMQMMRQMMSGDPIVVEVQEVQVNTDLPDEVFRGS